MDNGDGIKRDDLERIWEMGCSKAFSTETGLAFVKNVIENHNGEIDIQSEFKSGTKVTITINEFRG